MKKQFALAALAALIGLVSPAFAHEGHDHDHGQEQQQPDAHLAFRKNDVHAHLFWEQGPTTDGESVLRVEFADPSTHAPKEIQSTLSASLRMPEMNHGSAPTAIQRALDEQGSPRTGIYRISNIYFLMPGNWELNLKLKDSAGNEEVKTMRIHLDGSHEH